MWSRKTFASVLSVVAILLLAAVADAAITRLGDSGDQAGAIGDVDVLTMDRQRVITSVVDGNGDLKLISWSISSDGTTIQRRGDSGSQAGAASLIDTVFIGDDSLITAVRNGSGDLELITWKVSSDGTTIERLGDSGDQAGAVSLVDIVNLGSVVVTSVRNGSGDLELITWHLSPDRKIIQRADDSGDQAGAIGGLAATKVGGGITVTAVQADNGDLKLIAWGVRSSGAITRLSDSGSQAGAVELVSLVAGHSHTTVGSVLVTPVQDGGGNLKLIAWTMGNDDVIRRASDSGSQAGAISLLSTIHLSGGNTITAVRDGGGDLKLIFWTVSSDGGEVRRVADSGDQAGAISAVSTAHLGGGKVVTAVRDGGGNLELITWDVVAN